MRLLTGLTILGGTIAGAGAAWGGTAIGAGLGTMIAPGPGTVIGGTIGGILFCFAGGWAGSELAVLWVDSYYQIRDEKMERRRVEFIHHYYSMNPADRRAGNEP